MTRQSGISAGLEPGQHYRMGASFDGEGTNFAVFSAHGEEVYLCLFSADGRRELRRVPLPERTGDIWHGYVPGLQPGALYGYRVAGTYAPEQGHRFNVNKLLIDPYARRFAGRFTDHPATLGYRATDPLADLSFDETDSAPHAARSVVTWPDDLTAGTLPLDRGWDAALIYEAHVKGATAQHPHIPIEMRGTYEAMAHPAMLDHLVRLGVTAVELLPVMAMKSENALLQRGLVNYWGYNTIGFFAPEPRYFGPAGAAGFRAMVDRFHAAGIEVILDVVFNHTAEGDHLGPTLAFRGLDNASYYRLADDQPRYYVNDTGTGNTLDVGHPFVARMILDSLRFWVQVMGVDGFRFDLAAALGRTPQGFDPGNGLLMALEQDPVLARTKLIAEPWDVGPGGYQLGGFSSRFAEWNDRYRDTVRQFWRGDDHGAHKLAGVLLGTADVFDRRGRRAWSSVNFAAAHDGFTLADVTRYNRRHNLANGESNRDGHDANFSDNFGVEGDTAEPGIAAARARRQRNLLATVFLSQGTPMLLAGDEMGHTQAGNNNVYCQDNPTSWIDWTAADTGLVAFAAALSQFRRAHPVLRQDTFLHGRPRSPDGKPDVEWQGFDGGPLDWDDGGLGLLCLRLRGSGETARGEAMNDEVFLAFNRSDAAADLNLPDVTPRRWRRVIDTTQAEQAVQMLSGPLAVPPHAVWAFDLAEGAACNE